MNFRCKTAVVVAALLTLAGSPSFASTTEDSFIYGTRQWIAAYNAGDTESIVALYDKDAVVMPPDTPSASGHEAIRAFLIGDIKTSRDAGISLRVETDSTGAADNTGWHSGTFSVLDKDGKAVGTGKFLEVLQLKDGKWLIIRDIWNNDAAAAPAAVTNG